MFTASFGITETSIIYSLDEIRYVIYILKTVWSVYIYAKVVRTKHEKSLFFEDKSRELKLTFVLYNAICWCCSLDTFDFFSPWNWFKIWDLLVYIFRSYYWVFPDIQGIRRYYLYKIITVISHLFFLRLLSWYNKYWHTEYFQVLSTRNSFCTFPYHSKLFAVIKIDLIYYSIFLVYYIGGRGISRYYLNTAITVFKGIYTCTMSMKSYFIIVEKKI